MQSPKNENNKKNIYDTLTVENIKEFIYDNAITVENIKNLLQDETKIKDKILLKLLKNYVLGEKMKKYNFITENSKDLDKKFIFFVTNNFF